MNRLLLSAIVLIVLSSSSCTIETKEIRARLQEAESLLNIAPDSSLSIINKLDHSKLKRKDIKAETALIHSIALDKTATDICNDSIIAPAIAFYSKKGNNYQKSRTFYYTARIFENAQDPESAMEWLIKSEKHISKETDKHFSALVYSSKGRIYNSLHEYENGAVNYSKASQLYLEEGNIDRFAISKLREATCLLTAKDYEATEGKLKSIEKFLNELSVNTLAKYYALLTNLLYKTGHDGLMDTLRKYLQTITDERLIDWITVSRILLRHDRSTEAYEALEKHQRYVGADERYYYILAQVHESLGNLPEALEAYKRYVRISSMIGEDIITQDTRFIEERQSHLTRHEKAKGRMAILILSITVVLLALALALFIIASIRNQLTIKQNEQIILQSQLDGLMMEREELARTYTENEEGRRIISERLRIIDNFVFSDILQDDMFEQKASETLKKIISDREEFIRQNRLIFNQSCPRFIDFLKTRELTDMEIEHCCLYAIGLNGKMVTNFTNMKRHYHIGSSIRKKLGLNGHDTNISIYIKNLLKEYE